MTEVRNKFFEGYKPDFLSAYGDKRVWHKDMELCQSLNDWYEGEWQAGQEDGSRIIEIYEIVPDEPFNFVAECDSDLTTNFIMESRKALPYWLQQYAAEKECANGLEQTLIQTTASLVNAEAREKKMRDEIDGTIPLLEAAGLLVRASRLRELLASLYPLEKEEEAK